MVYGADRAQIVSLQRQARALYGSPRGEEKARRRDLFIVLVCLPQSVWATAQAVPRFHRCLDPGKVGGGGSFTPDRCIGELTRRSGTQYPCTAQSACSTRAHAWSMHVPVAG